MGDGAAFFGVISLVLGGKSATTLRFQKSYLPHEHDVPYARPCRNQ